jgi:hypothetical protein
VSGDPWGVVLVCEPESPLLRGWAPGAQPPACVVYDEADKSWGPGDVTNLAPVGLPLWWGGAWVREATSRIGAVGGREAREALYDCATALETAAALARLGTVSAYVVVDEDGREGP